MPAFGGNRGGKPRKDGLPPGSPQADEADRKADTERKRLARQNSAQLAEPAPLPALAAPGPGPEPAPPGAVVPAAPGEGAAPEPVVPWDPATLRPLFEELIEGAEESRVQKFRNMATEGGLPDKLVQEIARDAKYPPMAKRTMSITAPNVTAKAFNRIGLSGKYSDEAILATALIANLVKGRRLQAKLQKLIEQNQARKKELEKEARKTGAVEAPKP